MASDEGNSAGPAGWAARHPQVAGALLLVALHAAFLLGPHAATRLSRDGLRAPMPWEVFGLDAQALPLMIGFVQAFYVVPAVLLALKLRHPQLALGMFKAAVATFVLNLAGCGVMFWQLTSVLPR